ncbi:MAG: aldehyde dehydrogenase family protein, partial [Verrucomicrobiota bacterium]
LKPSELAPASSALLAEIVADSFNPHHVAVIEGGAEAGQQLMEHPFDAWFYTGSERVGRLYAEAAARHLAPITLELGGKCPAILLEDAPLAPTVERLVATKFFNAGQTCMAPDFVVVPEMRRKEFVEALVEELERAYRDHPEDLARIVNESHFDRLDGMLTTDAIQVGENRKEDRFFAPTIIPSARWDDPAMKEEVFGPILPVIGYRDLETLVEQLADRPSPLALYVFSANRALSEAVAEEIPSGSVCFNDAVKQATTLQLPFGGVGASGMGRYRGRHGFETFTYARAVTRRWFWKDPFLTKPPYGDTLERLRKILK